MIFSTIQVMISYLMLFCKASQLRMYLVCLQNQVNKSEYPIANLSIEDQGIKEDRELKQMVC